jgi:hypothetical protein
MRKFGDVSVKWSDGRRPRARRTHRASIDEYPALCPTIRRRDAPSRVSNSSERGNSNTSAFADGRLTPISCFGTPGRVWNRPQPNQCRTEAP